jgi:SAM-dependent methyltransferase
MEETRIYGKEAEISPSATRDFWEHRLDAGVNNGAVMLNEKTISDKRNAVEKKLLESLLAVERYSVLDIGCGLGRWTDNFAEKLDRYDGCDFSRSFIDAASKKFAGQEAIHFYNIPATQADAKKFTAIYNLVIINGLCMYMNDAEVKETLRNVSEFIENGAQLYFRESVSVIKKRLTLKNFPSAELGVLYNAVYRTPAEYEQLFRDNFSNFTIKSQGLLHAQTGSDIWQRTETNQYYWLISKG